MTLLERLSERWEKMDGAAATKIDRILKDRREAAAEIKRLLNALNLARLHIEGSNIEHAIVSLDHLGVGLLGYIDAVISETNK